MLLARQATAYVFQPLHRIRVAVSSSNNPRFGPNPNTGANETVSHSDGHKTVVAHNTVHLSRSKITFPIVNFDQLPPHRILNDVDAFRREHPLAAKLSKVMRV